MPNFYFQNGDGMVRGPHSLAEMREFVRKGIVLLETSVRDDNGPWKNADAFEFDWGKPAPQLATRNPAKEIPPPYFFDGTLGTTFGMSLTALIAGIAIVGGLFTLGTGFGHIAIFFGLLIAISTTLSRIGNTLEIIARQNDRRERDE